MSANAPSDEAWATLLTQVAELQRKIAMLESKAEIAENEVEALRTEFTYLEDAIPASLNYEVRLYEAFDSIAQRLGVALFVIWDGQVGTKEV